jgi:ketosteroid isomerase-like protein
LFFDVPNLNAVKKIIITAFSIFIVFCSYSQEGKIEKEIRQMEERRVAALLKKDTAALLKIYSPSYAVNRPIGILSTREKSIERVVADSLSFNSYKFGMEKIIIKKDLVITMGNETVEPSGKNRDAGKTLKRRYTHVWSKENGYWVLIVRHANILCQ